MGYKNKITSQKKNKRNLKAQLTTNQMLKDETVKIKILFKKQKKNSRQLLNS